MARRRLGAFKGQQQDEQDRNYDRGGSRHRPADRAIFRVAIRGGVAARFAGCAELDACRGLGVDFLEAVAHMRMVMRKREEQLTREREQHHPASLFPSRARLHPSRSPTNNVTLLHYSGAAVGVSRATVGGKFVRGAGRPQPIRSDA